MTTEPTCPSSTGHLIMTRAPTNLKGGVFEDSFKQMGKIITESKTLVNLGPITNFPDLLERHPDAAKDVHAFAMAGSTQIVQ